MRGFGACFLPMSIICCFDWFFIYRLYIILPACRIAPSSQAGQEIRNISAVHRCGAIDDWGRGWIGVRFVPLLIVLAVLILIAVLALRIFLVGVVLLALKKHKMLTQFLLIRWCTASLPFLSGNSAVDLLFNPRNKNLWVRFSLRSGPRPPPPGHNS